MSEWTAAMRGERFEAAWAVADRALRARDPATRDDPTLPYHRRWVWDGRRFDGRDVLVRCYHGLGDTIQFARFLPLLRKRVASLTLEVQPRLVGLLSTVCGSDRVIPFDPAHPAPASECDLEITELSLALRATPADAPALYLNAARAVLPSGTVALCHRAGDWDAERNVPADMFAALCRIAPCITLDPEPSTLPVLNPQGCPFDMGATAALVGSASLVITVDTMVAHLAGAMGRPTWLLLKAEPDWRWDPAATRSSWYPTMRLYAQPRAGDWAPVLKQVAQDLAARGARAMAGPR